MTVDTRDAHALFGAVKAWDESGDLWEIGAWPVRRNSDQTVDYRFRLHGLSRSEGARNGDKVLAALSDAVRVAQVTGRRAFAALILLRVLFPGAFDRSPAVHAFLHALCREGRRDAVDDILGVHKGKGRPVSVELRALTLMVEELQRELHLSRDGALRKLRELQPEWLATGTCVESLRNVLSSPRGDLFRLSGLPYFIPASKLTNCRWRTPGAPEPESRLYAFRHEEMR